MAENLLRTLAESGLNPERLTRFCYPGGLYQSAFWPWLAEAGVVSAVTCVPGLETASCCPRFIDTGTTSDMDFEGCASGRRHFIARSQVNVAL